MIGAISANGEKSKIDWYGPLSSYYRVQLKTQAVGTEEEWNSIENDLKFPLVISAALLYQGYVTLCRKLCTLSNSGISSTLHFQSSLTNCRPANLMSHLCQGQGCRVGRLCS